MQNVAPSATRRSPLDGVIVVDLWRALAGPQAAMMLADMGARVIKVDSPAGDESRQWGPPFVGSNGISTYFLAANRNKESVTADLKSPEGRDLLHRLVSVADVLIENFRLGVLARLGSSVYELHRINPALVICSLTGFGHDGPEGRRPGHDQIAQGEAGLMSLTGPSADEPTKVGVPIRVDHPSLGEITLPGPAIRLDDNACAGARSTHTHPPLLGEHNASVTAWLDSLELAEVP